MSVCASAVVECEEPRIVRRSLDAVDDLSQMNLWSLERSSYERVYDDGLL